jgi:hypothetical protein
VLADKPLCVPQLSIRLLRYHRTLGVPGNTPRNPLNFRLRQGRDTTRVVFNQQRSNNGFLCHPLTPHTPRQTGQGRVPLAFWDDLCR